ncbi:hypothetical protein F5Y19DRAFT_469075 [Xylariaceae sp. FL1651]|nr:hypothetical protein F5Y19DRAFT_469075 [Xylariaceae sp. FL1651]
MESARDVLETSFTHFKALQPPRLFERFQQTKLDDLKREIVGIQKSQDERRHLMDFSRINYFITTFHGLQLAAHLTAEQTSCIWGPVNYVLHMVKDSKALDDVLQSYRDLGKKVPVIQPYRSLVDEKPEVSICLAYMYQDLLQFQNNILQLLAGHGWDKTFHVNWKDYYDNSFSDMLDSFDHHGKTLEGLLQAHHRQISNDISMRMNNHLQIYQDDREMLEQHIRQYTKDRKKLLRNAKDSESERKRKQLHDVREWISAPISPQEKFHRGCADKRDEFPETAKWILKNVKVSNWIYEESPTQPILWMNGKKGAGKTILASQIVDSCIKDRPTFKTSYFYCREDDPSQNTCLAIYKSLLSQMLEHHRELLPSCNEKRLKGHGILNDDSIARSLIEMFCNADMNQFIIIDGVDEIDSVQRKGLVQFLSRIVAKCDETHEPGKIRVLLVSQDLADYRQLKCMEYATILDLDPDDTQKDIKRFLVKKVKEFQPLRLEDRDIQRAQELTIARSDGMFLFASLAIDNLINQPTAEYFQQELQIDVFPEDLHTAYKRIIERLQRDLNPNQWTMAKKIFGWLACAKRPLHWHEIQAALAIVPADDGQSVTMDYYGKRLRQDVRKICGSLVQKLDNRIIFTHHTAKRYVVETEQLDKRIIECDFTITCLSYLASPFFQRDLGEDERRDYAREGYYSFQDYALAKWAHHLEAFIQSGSALLRDPLQGASYQLKISQAVRRFVGVYQEDLIVPNDAEGQTPQARRCEDLCEAFSSYDFYQDLVDLCTHTSRHQSFKEKNKVGIKTLESALKDNRTLLEAFSDGQDLGGSSLQALQELYGEYMFKCDRLTCDYFYEGFENKEAREAHLRRHDRPYRCPVAECSVVTFGFSTNKDKEKHIRTYHPSESSQATFIQLPREFVEDAKFPCSECGQTFTRKANRDAHIRSHFGQRPYACTTCDRAFTRANDLRRHDKQRHVRGRI